MQSLLPLSLLLILRKFLIMYPSPTHLLVTPTLAASSSPPPQKKKKQSIENIEGAVMSQCVPRFTPVHTSAMVWSGLRPLPSVTLY